MAEVTFALPYEIPRGTRKVNEVKYYLEAQISSIGVFGKDGRSVGIGYEWETHTGLGNGGLAATVTLAMRLKRWLTSTGILHRQAETYLLGAKITYIRDGEPSATVTLKEG